MNAEEDIRYPVGYNHRHNCVGAFAERTCSRGLRSEEDDGTIDMTKLYNYIDGRKEIYLKEYVRLAKKERQLYELRQKLIDGINLLIVEVDGHSRIRSKRLDYVVQFCRKYRKKKMTEWLGAL